LGVTTVGRYKKGAKKGIVKRKSELCRGLSWDEIICPAFGTRIPAKINRVAPHNIPPPKKKKFEKVLTGGKFMATGFFGVKKELFV
jgi:hypothetical protein